MRLIATLAYSRCDRVLSPAATLRC